MKTYVFFQRSIILFFIVLVCKTDLYAQDFPKFQYKIGATATYDFSTSWHSGFGVEYFSNLSWGPVHTYSFYTYSLGSYALTQQFYFKKWFLNLDLGAAFIQNKASYVIDVEGLSIYGNTIDQPVSVYLKTNNVFLMGSLTFNRYFSVGDKAGLSVGLGVKLSHFMSDSEKNNKYTISGELGEVGGNRYYGDEEIEGVRLKYDRSTLKENFTNFFTPIFDASYYYHFSNKHTLFFKGSVAVWNVFRFGNNLDYELYDDDGMYYFGSILSTVGSGSYKSIFSLSVGYTFGITKKDSK